MKNPKSRRKIYKPLLILSFVVALAISSTTAYFTGLSQSDDNIFTSGNLDIDVTQDDVLAVQNWSPGSEQLLEFAMTNTGSMTEYVKGYLGGVWNSDGLDSSVFRIEKLERKIADAWVTINADGLSMDEEFYLSAEGRENTLFELAPGAREDFRLLISLSEEAGDEYQNEFFTANLHLAAKQVVIGSQWPAMY